MKKLLSLTFLIVSIAAFAQKDNPTTFYVVFNNSITITNTKNITQELPELKTIAQTYNIGFKQGIRLSNTKKKHFEECSKKVALKKNAKKHTKLSNIFIVYPKNKTSFDATGLKNSLEKLPFVKYCYVSSNKKITPPTITPQDIAPVTPDYTNNQGYIGSDPGVNMQYAWDQGYNGGGISIADIEYGFNPNHEDFLQTQPQFATGMTMDTETDPGWIIHGTGVAGIVYAGNNGYGVTGLAHGADQYTLYSESTEENGYDRIYAITRAIDDAKKGDIIIYELQATGVNEEELVPAEYNKIIWELTKSASDAGITIVAAAGNGKTDGTVGIDLDNANYKSYMDYGDSGAIIVGGGTPDTAHNKVAYSTYGSRVNLQGWAEKVWSTSKHGHDYPKGTCTVNIIGNDDNQAYTSCFRGTSSATPIVASCAAVLQGYFYSQSQQYLTPLEIREILITTGTPQGTGGHIGPLPNMEAALKKVDTDYLLSTPKESFNANFIMAPNPSYGKFNVTVPNYFSNNCTIEISTTLGRPIYKQSINTGTNPIDLTDFQSGLYLVKIYDNNYSATKRIVKN